MDIRGIAIKATVITIIVGTITTLLISNKPDATDNAPTSKNNYRTYSYGYSQDVTDSYSRLLTLYRSGQKSNYICASLEQCGNSLYLNGYYAKAFEAYIMAMEMAEDGGNAINQTSCYYNIGNIYVIFKDYERAAHYYEKVLAQPASKRNKSTRSLAARYLVMCYAKTGEKEKAEQMLKRAERMPLSDRNINEYYTLYCTALVEEMNGNHNMALSMHKKAYDKTRACGLKIGMGAYPLNEQGRIFAAAGRINEAISVQRMAMNVAKKEKAYDQLDDACMALDSLFRMNKQPDSATVYLNMHRELSAEMLNTADFYAARNKLINYEDGVKSKRINLLEQKMNVMLAVTVMVMLVLAIIVFYNQKLRKAYRMLTMKNQQLIAEQDENRKLMTEKAEACTIPHNANHDYHASENTKIAEGKNAEGKKDNAEDKLTKRIIEIMNDTDVICNSSFNLQTLARMAGSNTKYVSAAISNTNQGSFKSMLNEYRTREACRRLTDKKYQAYTIQAVAETVGYVSVNNFIVQFKKYTGMTPSIYRKNAIGI